MLEGLCLPMMVMTSPSGVAILKHVPSLSSKNMMSPFDSCCIPFTLYICAAEFLPSLGYVTVASPAVPYTPVGKRMAKSALC